MRFDQERLRVGGANLAGLHSKGHAEGTVASLGRAIAILQAAVQFGFRKFDTAPLYGWGFSEYLWGRASEKVDLSGWDVSTKSLRRIIPRIGERNTMQPDFWGQMPEPFCSSVEGWGLTRDSVYGMFTSSLQRLKCAKVGALKLHDTGDAMHEIAGAGMDLFDEAIAASVELQAAGYVSLIGLANKDNNTGKMLILRHPGVFRVVGTTTYNLLDQTALSSGLIGECIRDGGLYQANGPFNSKILAVDPRSAVEKVGKNGRLGLFYNGNTDDPVTINYWAIAVDEQGTWQNRELYKSACGLWTLVEKLGYQSPRAFALQFCLANPDVGEVVVGAGKVERFAQMKADIELEIPKAHWQALVDEGFIYHACPLPV